MAFNRLKVLRSLGFYVLAVLVASQSRQQHLALAQSAELGIFHAKQYHQQMLRNRKNFNALKVEIQSIADDIFRSSTIQPSIGDTPAIPAWLAQLLLWLESEASQPMASVSKPCATSLAQLLQASIKGNETWALKFLDASGKLGSGVLEGNEQVIGSFDECLDIGNSNTSPFASRYCTTIIGSKSNNFQPLSSTPAGVSVAVCVPAQCNADDVKSLTNVMLNQTRLRQLGNFTVLQIQCNSNDDSEAFDGPAIVSLVILGIFGSLLIFGTLLDASLCRIDSRHNSAINSIDEGYRDIVIVALRNEQEHQKHRSFLIRVLLCWSVLRNGRKLLAVKTSLSTRSGDAAPSLNCIHGIRFVSMCWIIYAHSFYFSVSTIKNPLRLLDDLGAWYFQPISNGTLSVDTFFFVSGLLLAYVVAGQEHLRRRINWFQYYVHRYWRLTPPYMLTLAVLAGLFKYMAQGGPFWKPDAGFPQQCANSWWTNLLYVNNMFRIEEQCMAWSWYLANDMQFYVISPLFIIPFFYRRSLGIAVWAILMLAYFGATTAITITYNLPASMIADVEEAGLLMTYFKVYYVKPWTRIGPYLVGVAFGYLVFEAKQRRWRMKQWQSLLGWPLALAASAGIIFSLAGENPGNSHIGVVGAAFYNVISRPGWGLIVGFVVLACETGGGGFITTVFSFPGFIPLSRLTYCAYLIHPALQILTYGRMTTQIGYSKLTLSIFGFGFIFASFALAAVVSLLFESPALGIEKVVTSAYQKFHEKPKTSSFLLQSGSPSLNERRQSGVNAIIARHRQREIVMRRANVD